MKYTFSIIILSMFFNVSVAAESKGNAAATFFKKLIQSDDIVSKEELIALFRGDNYLCYGLSEDGKCNAVEVVNRYYKNGLNFTQYSMSSDGYIMAFSYEQKWKGDRLCEVKPFFRSVLVPSHPSTKVYFDSSKMKLEAREDLLKSYNKNADMEFGDHVSCYEYRKSKKTPQVMLQIEYIEGVMQDSKDFATATVFGKSSDSVELY